MSLRKNRIWLVSALCVLSLCLIISGCDDGKVDDAPKTDQVTPPVENTSLPEGYKAVEFVEAHGQEWIDTGYIPTANTRSEVDFQVTLLSAESNMGVYGQYKGSRHQIFYSLDDDELTFGVGAAASHQMFDTERHFAILDNKSASVTLDGVKIAATGGKYSSADGEMSIYLFGANQAEKFSSHARIFSAEIYENDKLIHKYIPCYGEKELEYGMYDMIDNKFLKNTSGAGQLTSTPITCLTVPKGITLAVYNGFGDEEIEEISKVSEEAEGEVVKHYYALPEGNYNYMARGDGYYSVHKNFILTAADLEKGGKQIDANPGKMSAERKYEANPERVIYSFTDELLNSELMSMDALLSKYPKLLDTPAFSPDKANAQFTSQEEMAAFIADLDKKADNMYVYTVGKTANGKDIYLTVHSDENLDGKTLEEAAAALKANGKPTICLYGLIHGLEPSGGEGPLATIRMLAEEYGKTVLGDVNVIVLPWINGDGAEGYLYGTPGGCDNLNRYNLSVDYPELEATHLVYNLFMPEVVASSHEKGLRNNGGVAYSGTLMDVGLDISVNLNSTRPLCALSKDMMKAVIELSAADGFRMDRHEQADVSGQYPVVDMNYFGLRGSVSFLIEVPGIRAPKDNYERRTASHFVVMKNIIEYVIQNSEKVMQTVAADRKTIAENGAVFDASDLITLRHGQNSKPDWTAVTPLYSMTDGSLLDANNTSDVVFWETPLATRTRPTAYVIPADLKDIEFILHAMDYNGISYYKLSAGESALLRRYGGTVEKATLEEESKATFANGAYVFTMNQESANALAMLLEPDVYRTTSYAISLAQAKKLDVTDIYRCERDLVDGKLPIA
ncbi:MAG: hypothetical protein IJF14_03605 [Clostridia bacterium]|nr:hypothetical protein [Clostridia bacterium]